MPTKNFTKTALQNSARAIDFLNSHGVSFKHEKLAYEIKAQIEDRFYWHNDHQPMPQENKKVLLEQLLAMPSSELLLVGQSLKTIAGLEENSSLRYRKIQAAMKTKSNSITKTKVKLAIG